MKGELDELDRMAWDGPVRISYDLDRGIRLGHWVVWVDDVEETPYAAELENLLASILGDPGRAKTLAREAASNLGPWV